MIAFADQPSTGRNEKQLVECWLQTALHEPAREFLAREGKRIRADLVQLAYSSSGGKGRVPPQLPEFVELLHAGSLIIDDIQDEAHVRRGKSTVHRECGVPLAINTGNWLYFAAMEQLSQLPLDIERQLAAMREATRIVRRCHEGQALDLSLNVREMSAEEIRVAVRQISRRKTASLVGLCAWLGSLVAGAQTSRRNALRRFGMELGIGLQMQNDLIEIRNAARESKPSTDLLHGRVTWPWAWFVERPSPTELSELQAEKDCSRVAKLLWTQVSEIGMQLVRRRLGLAFSRLSSLNPEDKADVERQSILQRLEGYYV